MADITISVRADLEAELEAAVLDAFANPDSLSGMDLAKEKLEAILIDLLNKHRVQQAKDAAEAGVTKETDLS